MAFHISNRRLDLKPVLANLAHDAGFTGLFCGDSATSDVERDSGKAASVWVVMSRKEEDLEGLAKMSAGNHWNRTLLSGLDR